MTAIRTIQSLADRATAAEAKLNAIMSELEELYGRLDALTNQMQDRFDNRSDEGDNGQEAESDCDFLRNAADGIAEVQDAVTSVTLER